jgi:hypothetical protein
MADKRITYTYEPVTREDGVLIHFDSKYDPATGRLRVYRVYGDVTRADLTHDALHGFTQALGLA